MEKQIALSLFLLFAPASAWAANTSISNGEGGASVRGKLNTLLNQTYNVRQPPYNAHGDDYSGGGRHDDTTAIQNAINDACTAWGGTVYFPPGSYLVTTSLVFDACNAGGAKARINLVGEGARSSYINCNLVGFCIDQHAVNTATGVGLDGGLWTLDGLSIANKLQSAAGYGDVAGGALRFEGMTPGQTVNNCYLTGGVGLVMANVTFGGSVNNCGGSGPGGIPNAVGIYAGQISISNVRFLGWKYAFAANSTTTMTAISTESSDTGVVVGLVLPNVFRGFIDDGSGNGTYTGKPGSVLTVTKYAYGPFDSDDGSGAGGHGSGIHSSLSISHSVCLACAPGSTITSQLSTSQVGRFNGAEGRYQLDRPSNPAVPVQTMATDYRGSQPNGVSITGWQTERLNTGLAVWGAFGLAVQNANITGTIGLGIAATRASWSSANGGTITYNLRYDSGRYGAKTCFAESFSPRYNFDQTSSPAFPGGLSCQWQGNVVQIRGVDNPGAPLNGNIPNPGPNLVNGIISPNQDACLSIGHVNASTFRNINCATASLYEIDLSGYNPEGRGRIGFYEMTVSPGLVAPIALPTCACRASIVVQNSYGFGEASLQARYQDLPGVPGAQPNSVYEGEEHLILDAGTCSDGNACNTWGATVTGGGGSKHVKVRWNGTNWTIVGK